MKFHFLFFPLLFALQILQAQQCPPCPIHILINDTINCNNKVIDKDSVSNYFTNPATDLFTACKNSTMKYVINPESVFVQGNLCTYSVFSIDSVIVSGGALVNTAGNTITVQWGAASTGSVLIAFSIPGNTMGPPCIDTILLKFALTNNPTASFFAVPQPACFNNPTTIQFNSNATIGALTYYWDFGDGYTALGSNPSHAYENPGTYTVCLFVSNNMPPSSIPIGQVGPCLNCMDSVCQTITIDPLSGPDIECIATVCAGDTNTYCTAAICSSYNWSVVGGSIIGSNNTSCVQVAWGSGNPQGSLQLIASACSTTYCPQGTTYDIPIIPSSYSISGLDTVCINASATYSLPTWPGTSYTWSLSSGGTITGNNTNTSSIGVYWTNFGSHTISVSYYDTTLQCGGNATLVVEVLPNLEISGPKIVCEGTIKNYFSFNIPANTPIASSWSISPGGNTINTGNGTSNISVSWLSAGTYTITANAVNPSLVCEEASYEVQVLAAPILAGISGTDSICPGAIQIYAANSNASGVYTWTVLGGSFISLAPNNDSIQISWNNTGPYSISVFQTALPSNCVSNTLSKTLYSYPVPNVLGNVNVCADAIETYTISNINSGNFNWYVTPSNLATIISGQGTDTVQIKWHGSNNPGSSTTVFLHYGICNKDSIAIQINEPLTPNITASGSLCGGGVNLTVSGTGTYLWSCLEHPISPSQSNVLSSLTALDLAGHYSVQISNYNNTGCTVEASYQITSNGLPNAQITASSILQYCISNLPNMTLSALTGAGYSYQWYMNATPVGTGSSLAVNAAAPCFVNALGTYVFYCDVSYLGCTVSSNTITVTILNCTGSAGGGTGTNNSCGASINITNVSQCNPFSLSVVASAPLGASILSGTETITHLDDNSVLSGLTTKTYTSLGYKLFKVCADVLLPNSSICNVCKDTSALVDVIGGFIYVDSCGIISITDQSNVFAPNTINAYSYYVGDYPNNITVSPTVASINNPSLPNPIITFSQSGTYIINQFCISSNACVASFLDTIVISLPDADFVTNSACINTPVLFTSTYSYPTHFWDFGDASSSYTDPTTHAYSANGVYNIVHIVQNNLGCVDTFTNSILINPNSTCIISYASPSTFCFGDSIVLQGCAGLTNYQWYNNGVPIPSAINSSYVAKQNGNYYFIAEDPNTCLAISDTVSVNVLVSPSTTFFQTGSTCENSLYSIEVPNCATCFYMWSVDNVIQPSTSYILNGTVGIPPFTVGLHTIQVQVLGSNGCISSDSLLVDFYAIPSISTTVVGSPSLMCSNNTYTISAISNANVPSWSWSYNGFVISTNSTSLASAAGTYIVQVTDGITGCTAIDQQVVFESPNLSLFPIGCDSLCDTSSIWIPLGSINGDISAYTINWYDNAPPYTSVGTGANLLLSSLGTGNHALSVIVSNAVGCKDTSNVYNLNVYPCVFVLGNEKVELNVFLKNQKGLLEFTTNQDDYVQHYEIEKSTDMSQFETIAYIFPEKNNNESNTYSYTDSMLSNGSNYYRIKLLYHDKHAIYTETKHLFYRTNTSTIIVPTVSNGQFNILSIDAINKVVVSNTAGIILKTILSIQPIETIHMSELASGIYYVTLYANGVPQVFKVIKH
ncbi:MAG: PKD domain-containing protein [Chitinophagaceae bacterium]